MTRKQEEQKATYRCYVSTVGNPDFNQYAPISNPEWIEAANLKELRTKVQAYNDEWGVGSGNCKDPIVYEMHGKAKTKLGTFSYNLRLWAKQSSIVGGTYIEGVELDA